MEEGGDSEAGEPELHCDIEMAREVLREAELYLGAQLTIAISADQRATQTTSIMVAAAAAVLAGTGAYAAAAAPHGYLLAAGLVVVTCLTVAAFVAGLALLPADFYPPGNQPQQWMTQEVLDLPLERCLLDQAKNTQDGITKNDVLLAKNAKRLRRALQIAAFAPLVGASVAAAHFIFAVVATACSR